MADYPHGLSLVGRRLMWMKVVVVVVAVVVVVFEREPAT